MDAAIIIPARYQSSRFPGKPLAMIKGATGREKSLIARCIEAARLVGGSPTIVVATDDDRIAAEAANWGAEAVITSSTCRNGSERIAEAVAKLGIDKRILVNFQGDAPLTPPWFVDALLNEMQADASVAVATPVMPYAAAELEKVRRDLAEGKRGPTAVVFDNDHNALYFSKELIPSLSTAGATPDVFHHIGLYAYRTEALADYAMAEPTRLELAEGLEQLRFLERGTPVRAVEVDSRGRVQWEVNFPGDVAIVEEQLARLAIP
jgi:3-deoxy-manno-octulosonate cytidylyltransferase (CMP-KDO synthetase)